VVTVCTDALTYRMSAYFSRAVFICVSYDSNNNIVTDNPSSRTMALGSTQPLTEMSTRNHPGGKKRPARRADNLAANHEPNV
jgi:hypothetical protein